jgi:hypothetical protein
MQIWGAYARHLPRNPRKDCFEFLLAKQALIIMTTAQHAAFFDLAIIPSTFLLETDGFLSACTSAMGVVLMI